MSKIPRGTIPVPPTALAAFHAPPLLDPKPILPKKERDATHSTTNRKKRNPKRRRTTGKWRRRDKRSCAMDRGGSGGPERAADDHYVMREQWPAAEERERIDRVARFVARDGDLSEAVLVRLLRITRNRHRWGFLAPDHPHHAFYLRRKVSEQCRILRRPS